jgi:chloramphenicol-sensitive protein RarD
LWLLLTGPLTALPLLCFAAAARRLPLATLGMVQYSSPTLQLLLGIWVLHEPFDRQRLFGFALIWSALLLLSVSALRQHRSAEAAACGGGTPCVNAACGLPAPARLAGPRRQVAR